MGLEARILEAQTAGAAVGVDDVVVVVGGGAVAVAGAGAELSSRHQVEPSHFLVSQQVTWSYSVIWWLEVLFGDEENGSKMDVRNEDVVFETLEILMSSGELGSADS